MEERIEAGSYVKLKTGSPAMRVDHVSEDGLIAYCSWEGLDKTKYVKVAFLKSALILETKTLIQDN